MDSPWSASKRPCQVWLKNTVVARRFVRGKILIMRFTYSLIPAWFVIRLTPSSPNVNGEKEIHKTLAKGWTEGWGKGEGVRKPRAIPRESAGLFKRIQLWEMALLKVTFRIDIIVETPSGLSRPLPILDRNFSRAFAEQEDRSVLAAFDI